MGAYIVTVFVTKELRTTISRPSRVDIALLLLVTGAWLGYGWYAVSNWNNFYDDMAYQFTRKSSRDIIGYMFTPANTVFIVITLVSLAYAIYKQLAVIPFLVLAVFLWMTDRIGHEMWYELFSSMAHLFLTIGLIHIMYDISSRILANKTYLIKVILPIVAGLAMIVWGYQRTYIENMLHYPQQMVGWTMKFPDTVKYITGSDIKRIKSVLEVLPPRSQPYLIQFQPRADALFFLDLDTKRFRIIHPTFCTVKPDIYILHNSRYLPSWWIKHARDDMLAARVSYRHNNALLFSRDKTERWYSRLMAAGMY